MHLTTNPDVVLVVLPPEVEEECKTIGAEFSSMRVRLNPSQKFQRKLERVKSSGEQVLGLGFDTAEADDGQVGYWNIHHAIKAHAMEYGLTTQIVWESTLRGLGTNQDPASTAWNFTTLPAHHLRAHW